MPASHQSNDIHYRALGAYIRTHQRSQRDPVSPLRNKLLSRRSNVDDDNGVFEFDNILGDAEIATCTEIVPEPDDDSYYSDYAYDCEYGGNDGANADKYLLVLPKQEWSGYFARFVKKING